MGKYDSIVRPPLKRPRMSREDRAKQFGAFDPLIGLQMALRKKEREVEESFKDKLETIEDI